MSSVSRYALTVFSFDQTSHGRFDRGDPNMAKSQAAGKHRESSNAAFA
jgi:hypothetical protein